MTVYWQVTHIPVNRLRKGDFFRRELCGYLRRMKQLDPIILGNIHFSSS
jgi:hypothetical protein